MWVNLSTSYFGTIDFLNSQDIFDAICGKISTILNVQPANNSPINFLPHMRLYADKCMLDIFLSICHENYVGFIDSSVKGILVHKICQYILELCQEKSVSGGEKWTIPAVYSK